MVLEYIAIGLIAVVGLSGIRIIRPTHMAVVETLGKYSNIKSQGITWVFPFVQKLYTINITEQMADVETQEIITKDNLNAMIDLQIYYKVKPNEEGVTNALYKVFNFQEQIVSLARTTMRNVIGTKNFVEVNSERNKLNDELRNTMQKEVDAWGMDIVRCELKEIKPPVNVQETMNKVLIANNEKIAAVDFATAVETKADGEKRASIKSAEGIKQAAILQAEGEATAIKTVADATAYEIEQVNKSADKFFVNNAQKLKAYEVTQNALANNSKIVLTEKGISPVIVLGSENNPVIPLPPLNTLTKK
jgi:regulator of protease activity HflC (stomatin/prohibitin superfamily)